MACRTDPYTVYGTCHIWLYWIQLTCHPGINNQELCMKMLYIWKTHIPIGPRGIEIRWYNHHQIDGFIPTHIGNSLAANEPVTPGAKASTTMPMI